VLESLLLAAAGCLLGVGLYYGLATAFQLPVEQQYGLYLPIKGLTTTSYWYLVAVISAGAFVALVPAWRAYRNALNDGLAQRW
jgi:putative ABC transport system permease protein